MTGCVALILAGGRGTRLGAERPKQYLPLGGVTLLRHAVAGFVDHPGVDGVRAVIGEADREACDRALSGLDTMDPVTGGATRQDSARLGLESLAPVAPDRVLIHDAARPFADAGTIARTLAALRTSAGALPAIPVSDTLKREWGDGGAPRVGETVERGRVVARADSAGLPLPGNPRGSPRRRGSRADRRCRGGRARRAGGRPRPGQRSEHQGDDGGGSRARAALARGSAVRTQDRHRVRRARLRGGSRRHPVRRPHSARPGAGRAFGRRCRPAPP